MATLLLRKRFWMLVTCNIAVSYYLGNIDGVVVFSKQ
jgi:hypothetical protein